MLHLTRLSGHPFALNPDLIERAEATPDTVVTLVNGSKYVIGESLDELIALVRGYRADLVVASRTGELPAEAAAPTSAGAHRARASRGESRIEHATVTLLRAEPGEA